MKKKSYNSLKGNFMKILLLEDEYILNSNIKEFLEMKGFEVESYTDGEVLLKKSKFDADIALLDIEVPGADGYEVIEWIKRLGKNIHTIFMTAYKDIQNIEKAYSLGCSDYLKKPFDLVELWLRIQKLSDKHNYTKVELENGFLYDMDELQLYNGDKLIKLTKIQRKILKILIKYRNHTVTYDILINEVWDDDFVKSNTIATHVKEIRKLLPDGLIESIRAEGYRLNKRC